MTPKDLSIIVRSVAPVIRELHSGVIDRVTAIEQRVASVKDGRDGRDGVGLKGDVGEKGETGPRGPEGPAGKDADETRIAELEATIQKMAQQIESLTAAVAKASDLEPAIEAAVTTAMAAIPAPKDGEPGRSVDPAEVAAMVADQVKAAVAEIEIPEPTGIVGTFIDKSGALVLTLSNGQTQIAGHVVGQDGKDVDPEMVAKFITDEVAKIPPPKDGKDGRDGFGFDDFEEEFDGDRTVIRRYRSGDHVKEFKHVFPIVLDRGVYKQGTAYAKGDGVTWGGSFWIAQQDTTAKPGEASSESRAWRLAVKKGSDGKQGAKGDPGPIGKQGPQGPQGRSGY